MEPSVLEVQTSLIMQYYELGLIGLVISYRVVLWDKLYEPYFISPIYDFLVLYYFFIV